MASVTAGQVSVGTVATEIVPAAGSGSRVRLLNKGGTSVFIGPSGVATTTGFELAASEAADLVLEAGESVYGIVAAGTETVHYLST